MAEKKSDHWSSLANLLGMGSPKPESPAPEPPAASNSPPESELPAAVEPPLATSPAAPELPAPEPTAPKKGGHWSKLANLLGLSSSPAPAVPVAAEKIEPLSIAATPDVEAKAEATLKSLFVPTMPVEPDPPRRDEARFVDDALLDSTVEDAYLGEDDSDDAREGEHEVRSMDPDGDGEPRRRRRRRRRRRGGAGVRPDSIGTERTTPRLDAGEREPDEARRAPESRNAADDRPRRERDTAPQPHPETEPAPSAEAEPSVEGEAETTADQPEPPARDGEAGEKSGRGRRRRGRRRRGRKRDGEPAAATASKPVVAADGDDAEDAHPVAPARIDSDDDDPLDDDLHAHHDDEEGEHGETHRKIPTWEETVGILVSANMAARARNPRGDRDRDHRGGRGRGRGRRP